MLTLAAADTLAGVAESATTVTMTISGLEVTTAGVETYKVLFQGQLPSSVATQYTVPASTTAFIRSISVVNTNDSTSKWFQLYRGGTADANAITQEIVIPAKGSAHFDGRSWSILPTSAAPWVTTVPTGTQIIDNQAAAAIPLVIQGHASQSADLFVVEDSAGGDLVAVTSAGILSIPGGGIKFPATQVASGDANTLDDYEEGTWTPGLSGWTVSGATTLAGKYRKIGSLVWWSCSLQAATSLAATGGGASTVTGLPFTVSGVSTGSVVDSNLIAYGTLYVTSTTIYPPTIGTTAATISCSGTYTV